MKNRKEFFASLGLVFIILIMLSICIGAGFASYFTIYDSAESLEANHEQAKKLCLYLASLIILTFISIAAAFQIKEILDSRKDDKLIRRADQIAIIIGAVLTLFLFKQPFLDKIFGEMNAGIVIQSILFASGGTIGWFIWYLRQLKKYGEFFNVLLMTAVIGFTWYARLTAPDEIQLTALAFLLSSFFRIAKDYMDKAASQGETIN